ncbi:MAG: hypothetical protein U0324_21805 [Polyangiales bacterium]
MERAGLLVAPGAGVGRGEAGHGEGVAGVGLEHLLPEGDGAVVAVEVARPELGGAVQELDGALGRAAPQGDLLGEDGERLVLAAVGERAPERLERVLVVGVALEALHERDQGGVEHGGVPPPRATLSRPPRRPDGRFASGRRGAAPFERTDDAR